MPGSIPSGSLLSTKVISCAPAASSTAPALSSEAVPSSAASVDGSGAMVWSSPLSDPDPQPDSTAVHIRPRARNRLNAFFFIKYFLLMDNLCFRHDIVSYRKTWLSAIQMTGCHMPVSRILKLRHLLGTDVLRIRASGMETAA